jgi:hypothetical protein
VEVNREHDYSLHYYTADNQVIEMRSKITKISCQENLCVCVRACVFPMTYVIYSTLATFLPTLLAKYYMATFLSLCFALYLFHSVSFIYTAVVLLM